MRRWGEAVPGLQQSDALVFEDRDEMGERGMCLTGGASTEEGTPAPADQVFDQLFLGDFLRHQVIARLSGTK